LIRPGGRLLRVIHTFAYDHRVARLGQRHHLHAAGTVFAYILICHVHPLLPVHGDEHPGLHFHYKKIGPGVVQAALTGVHREERHVDLLTLQRPYRRVKIPLGLLNLPQGGDLAPMPKVQIPGVEYRVIARRHQEGHAQIGGIVGFDAYIAHSGILAGF